MSCAYRTAATRIAAIAGIPPDLMLTAMDIARQRRIAFPVLPPDQLFTITQLLGIAPTCGNPQQVITRTQAALLALGTLHPTHPCVRRWLAVAALLGVPDDQVPVPAHPVVIATVREQWLSALPSPANDQSTEGFTALWRGGPIPTERIDEALRAGDRTAIVTWMAHGVWDDRFEDVCADLTDAEIGRIVRAGVMPDALVGRVAQRWRSDALPWDVFPLTMWDRVPDPDIARAGRARTAAMTLIHHPTLRDDRLIAVAAQEAIWAVRVLRKMSLHDDRLITIAAMNAKDARDVLIDRTDLSDDRLIDAVATATDEPWFARDVLVSRHDLHDHRLIATAAKRSRYARDVLIERPDVRDPCLIAAAAKKPEYARDVLIARRDLRDRRLIAAAAKKPECARDVLIARTDLRDRRLIGAAAKKPQYAHDVLIARTDLSDDRLIDAVATATDEPRFARDVLIVRFDVHDDRLITIAAMNAKDAHDVLIARPDLRTDDRLITAVVQNETWAAEALKATDLHDHRLIAAAAKKPWCAKSVLSARPDLRTNTCLLTAVARDRALVRLVVAQHPDLRDHPLLRDTVEQRRSAP